jgi:superfamily I DNA and RNA helicase
MVTENSLVELRDISLVSNEQEDQQVAFNMLDNDTSGRLLQQLVSEQIAEEIIEIDPKLIDMIA